MADSRSGLRRLGRIEPREARGRAREDREIRAERQIDAARLQLSPDLPGIGKAHAPRRDRDTRSVAAHGRNSHPLVVGHHHSASSGSLSVGHLDVEVAVAPEDHRDLIHHVVDQGLARVEGVSDAVATDPDEAGSWNRRPELRRLHLDARARQVAGKDDERGGPGCEEAAGRRRGRRSDPHDVRVVYRRGDNLRVAHLDPPLAGRGVAREQGEDVAVERRHVRSHTRRLVDEAREAQPMGKLVHHDIEQIHRVAGVVVVPVVPADATEARGVGVQPVVEERQDLVVESREERWRVR